MFSSNATRLARIDWSKYGRMELAGTTEPTNEQLKRAVEGLSVGMQQLAEELANVFGNYDLPLQHRAPFVSSNYTPDAPGVSPDEDELDKFYPQIAALANDGYYDDDDDQIKGGLAALFRGPVVFQPAINNPNVAGGNAQNNIVVFGGQGGGACFENLYVTNIYDKTTGAVWSAFPAGTVTLWAGSVGSIPSGWALMDGTANSVGNGGSGIDMRGMIPYGYSGSGAFATIGASVALTFTGAEINGNSTTPSVVNSNTTGITVNTPSLSHAGVVSPNAFDTLATNLDISPAPTTQDMAHGASANHYVWLVANGEPLVLPTSHDHSVDHDDVAAALQNHSASACTVSDSGHTHTVHIDNLAANLVLDPPTTLRTPGVVLAYIEKLSA